MIIERNEMKEKRFYVYSYSTEQDGVFWIGKGEGRRIKRNHKECPLCYNILEARKRENITVMKKKIYEDMLEDEAFAWEVYLIDFYKPRGNLTKGGEGASGVIPWNKGKHTKPLSLKHREKISEGLKKSNHPLHGSHHSFETRKKMSENHADFSGKNNPNWGKTFSCEHREKLRLAHAKLTWKQVKEIRKKYSIGNCDYGQLAKEFEVSKSCIGLIIQNRNWHDSDYTYISRKTNRRK